MSLTLAQEEAYWRRQIEETKHVSIAAFALGVTAGLRFASEEHAAEIAAMNELKSENE